MTMKMLGLGATLAVLMALPLAAQDAAAPPGLSRDDVAVGEPYISQTFRDWDVRCIRGEEGVPERCEMYQLLSESAGNPVAEFRISTPIVPEEGVMASAVLLTPLDTLLTPGLRLRIDDGQVATVPYAFCRPIGCFVQLTLSQEDVASFAAGADIFIELFALVRGETGQFGGAPVEITASLLGFTAAFDAVAANGEEIRAYLEEQEAAGGEEAPAEGEAEEAPAATE